MAPHVLGSKDYVLSQTVGGALKEGKGQMSSGPTGDLVGQASWWLGGWVLPKRNPR